MYHEELVKYHDYKSRLKYYGNYFKILSVSVKRLETKNQFIFHIREY